MSAILHSILPHNSPRIYLQRPRTRETYFEDEYYYEIYYKSCFPRIHRRHRRPVYSSPSLGRMYTDLPFSNFSDSDLHWVQSPRRTRTFTSHSATPDFITVDMDGGRRRGLWHSLFGSNSFDVFRMKRETRLRHEPIERSRSKLPLRQYTYTRIDETDYGDSPWTGPRIGTPRRAPTPPRPRRFRWRVRSRSPERHARHHWDDLPRGDTGRAQQPRARPTRPASPINERGPSRRGQYTPFAPVPRAGPSRQTVTIIQRNPRETAPRSTTTASASQATDVDIITHDSIRERINRKRFHSPLSSPLRLRKVRFREGHEEIDHPVYSTSDSDSDSESSSDSGSGSDSESESGLDSASGPSPTGSFVRSRHRPPVVLRQPRRESPAAIVERRPGAGGVQAGDELRGSMRGRQRERVGSEGVMYEYRQPRVQGRGGDTGRWI